MANTFGMAQARNARYWYERLIYTGWPFAGSGGNSSLPAGLTSLFSASGWNSKNNPTWRAQVETIQATQAPGVLLLWSADPQNQINALNQGDLRAARSGVRTMKTYIPAVDTLSMSLQNTGSAVSGFQLNYTVAMKRLTVLDKLAAQRVGARSSGGWYGLTPDEVNILKTLDLPNKPGLDQMKALVDKGTAPLGIERVLQGVYGNRETAGQTDFFAVDVTTADNTFATYTASMDPTDPTRGRFLVLTGLAVEGGANVRITVDRDGQIGYLDINGSAFAQTDDEPWDLWIPAVDYLSFHATVGPGGSPTTVGIRVRILTLQMSEVIAVQFGLAKHPSDVSGDTYAKVLAGVV